MTTLVRERCLTKSKVAQDLSFQILGADNHELMSLLEQYILENIQPIYGDQSGFLHKVREGKDRTCEFLLYRDNPVAFVIYKNAPSNEFAEFGVENGLELKTTVLLQKNSKTTGIFLRHLLGRVARRAVEMNADCFFGTISAKKQDVLRVMCRFGGNIVQTFNGIYLENVDEHLICHPNPLDLYI